MNLKEETASWLKDLHRKKVRNLYREKRPWRPAGYQSGYLCAARLCLSCMLSETEDDITGAVTFCCQSPFAVCCKLETLDE